MEADPSAHPKHLCLLVEPVEEIASPVALVGQKHATARRLGQSAGGNLVASVSWKEHRGEDYPGWLMNERMNLKSVKPVSRSIYPKLRSVLPQQAGSAVTGWVTEGNRQQVYRIELPPITSESAQRSCLDQPPDLVGQPLQATNPLLVSGTVRKRRLGVGYN